MSKNQIRKDKTCLNCGYVVENKFCPNCGQENSETRKTFVHLFFHFFEDLTHYENAFWKTIKNLLFKPASLSKEYLSGKRLSYLAPIRLYIFISFMTFFLLAILPNDIGPANFSIKEKEVTRDKNKKNLQIDLSNSKTVLTKKDSLKQQAVNKFLKKNVLSEKEKVKLKKAKESNTTDFILADYKSVKELDSLQKYGIAKNKLNSFEYWLEKKMITITKNNTKEELIEKAKESAMHNFPKVIIIYMPFFAFFLWLFHNKKKWYYFDNCIFTLHYFSFLLLILFLTSLVSFIFNLFPDSDFLNLIDIVGNTIVYCWMFYYFFPAHYRFYGESKIKSFIKSILLFFINLVFILLFLCCFVFYTFVFSIH
jgi:hypothetical protein